MYLLLLVFEFGLGTIYVYYRIVSVPPLCPTHQPHHESLLAGEEVLKDEGPEFVEAEGAVDEAEVDGIVVLGGDSARHFQTIVDATSWEAHTNTDTHTEREDEQICTRRYHD